MFSIALEGIARARPNIAVPGFAFCADPGILAKDVVRRHLVPHIGGFCLGPLFGALLQ